VRKVIYDRDSYFIGENGVYLELQNTKEYIDEDGIKRIVVELKDQFKISRVFASIGEESEPIEMVFEPNSEKKPPATL
jgi:hypothetical protein